MNSTPKITHIIYDMDGVLLDTEPFYTQVTEQIVQAYGKQFDWTIKSQMIGRQALNAARILVEKLNLPITPEAYLLERDQKLAALFPNAEPLPGAMALTEHFKKQGIPQAVATSSHQADFALKTSRHQAWFKTFACIIRGDHPAIKQGKPAPDIFLLAADCLQASPDQCLVFEDSPAGIKAAKAAGMYTVAVPDAMLDKSLVESADQILTSLTEFSPTFWGLPE